ncbi:MAG: hypothetical protein AAGD14_01470 [Planctomycetota bacterium]
MRIALGLAALGVLVLLILWSSGRGERGAPARAGLPESETRRAPRESVGQPVPTQAEERETALLVVRVLDLADRPRAGVPIRLLDTSRNVLASGTSGADGEYAWTMPEPVSVIVEYRPADDSAFVQGGRWFPRRPEVVTIRVGRPVRFEGRVLLDGKPGFPPGMQVIGRRLRVVDLDAVTATIRGTFIPTPRDRKISVRGDGYGVASQRVDSHEREPVFRLRSLHELVVRVLGDPDHVAVVVTEWQSPGGGWSRQMSHESAGEETDVEAAEGWSVTRYKLPAARYRVRTQTGRIVLAEGEIKPGAPTTKIDIDLRRALWVQARVFTAAGGQLLDDTWAHVKLTGEGVAEHATLLASRRFLHPGNRTIRLTPVVQRYRPEDARGSQSIESGGRTVDLFVVPAPISRFRWIGRGGSGGIRNFSLSLVDARTGDWHGVAHDFAGETDVLFRAPHDGVFHLVARDANGGTGVARDVRLFGAQDLGTIESLGNATLHVRARNKPQESRLRVLVFHTSSGLLVSAPSIAPEKDEIRIRALPVGDLEIRFRLEARRWTRRVVLNEAKGQTITVDCAQPR